MADITGAVVGQKVYRTKDYTSQVCDIQQIKSETTKYFKLENGDLISKENGKVRGTGGNGDWTGGIYYYLITHENGDEIINRYKNWQVKQLKAAVGGLDLRELEFDNDTTYKLILSLKEIIDIVKKQQEISLKNKKKTKA